MKGFFKNFGFLSNLASDARHKFGEQKEKEEKKQGNIVYETIQRDSPPTSEQSPHPAKEEHNSHNINLLPKKKDDNKEIVIVNSEPIENKKEGYYYKKYIDDILKIKNDQPMAKKRETMKITFDKDAIDYLFNDITTIFKDKSAQIEENQMNLSKKLEETQTLVNALNDLNVNTDENFNDYKKEVEMIEQIDYLDLFISSLSTQADQLQEEVNQIEKKIKGK